MKSWNSKFVPFQLLLALKLKPILVWKDVMNKNILMVAVLASVISGASIIFMMDNPAEAAKPVPPIHDMIKIDRVSFSDNDDASRVEVDCRSDKDFLIHASWTSDPSIGHLKIEDSGGLVVSLPVTPGETSSTTVGGTAGETIKLRTDTVPVGIRGVVTIEGHPEASTVECAVSTVTP